MIQLAALMGAVQIYLIGVDHRYSIKTKKDDVSGCEIWDNDNGCNHFSTEYSKCNTGHRWNAWEPEKMEMSYRKAREWSDKHGVKIVNLTPRTELDVFEKRSYDSIFKTGGSPVKQSYDKTS
jgi:hypothetical protein